MKPRSKPKKTERTKSLSSDAKFALRRKTEVAMTRRDPEKIPADRGAREKESSSQGSE